MVQVEIPQEAPPAPEEPVEAPPAADGEAAPAGEGEAAPAAEAVQKFVTSEDFLRGLLWKHVNH